MSVSVQKAISGNKVLAAFTFTEENIKGISIGVKNAKGYYVDSVVRIQEDKEGNRSLVISKEKYDELGCSIVWE